MYYQISEHYDPIGKKKITTKCPDCGNSNCLELSFYQKRTERPFGTRVTKKVSGILYCHTTKTEIAPVLWTDEIENYFYTEKSKLRLQPAKFKFAKRFYLLLIILFVAIAVILGFILKDYMTGKNIANVSKGDMVKTMYGGDIKDGILSFGNTWFLVKQIEADTIWLQRHQDYTNDKDFSFDLDSTKFNSEILKASLPKFKNKTLTGFDYSKQTFTGVILEIETNSK